MAHAMITKEYEPSNPVDGNFWYKPSADQVFMRIAGSWTPIATDEAIPMRIPLTFLIRGVDRSDNILISSLSKVDAITSQVDTLSFYLDDEEGTVHPRQGEEIFVFKKKAGDVDAQLWFGGEIDSAEPFDRAPGQHKLTYSVKCVDFSKRLNKELVTETYEDKTVNYIIADMIDTEAEEFTYNNVDCGITIDFIAFDRKPLFEALEELAGLVGYDFYVDYERDVHFFSKTAAYAPYSITENIATTGHYKNFKIKVDKSQLRNRITVRGGKSLTAFADDIQEADGERTVFNLAYMPRGDVKAYVDTGGGFVEKTVGIDNIDSAGFDFVVNVQEKCLKNLDLAKLTAGHILKVTYDRQEQIVAGVRDKGSIAAIKDIEGGTGQYRFYIVDENIDTVAAATERGKAELAIYSNPIIAGSYFTDQDGYRSGQLLPIDMPSWGYADRQFLIQKVTSKLRSDGTTFEYQIVFATRLKGLTDFLKYLYDQGQKIIIRNEEVVHELVELPAESLPITEGTPVLTLFTPPYKWGVDADQGVWNEAAWG